jgi:hypothetical protein
MDQICYWFSSGDHTSSVDLEVVLQNDVEEEILKYAVMRAMQIHGIFRSHPVIVEGRVKISIDDEISNVPVFASDDQPRRIGTSETNGYLFYFSYRKNALVFHIFHGLTDGMPSLEFLVTVVNCYVQKAEGVEYDQPEPCMPDDFSKFESVLESASDNLTIGRFVPENHKDEVFYISEERFEERSRKFKAFEIDVPLKPILSLAKSYGTSVLPLFEAMIGGAIRKYYDVGNRMIVGLTPVDMRRIFRCDTKHNASSMVALPYRAMMDELDLGKRAALLRRILEFQVRPENIRQGIKDICEPYKQADAQPYPIEQIVDMINWVKARKKSVQPYTYGLSYPGNISFAETVEPYIVSMTACVSESEVPFMIAACEVKGVIRMMISQSFEDDGLAKAIYREIAESIPETEFMDRGTRIFDRLDLKDLEHVNN